MLKTDVLTLGDYQTNCYILSSSGEKTCCVVDPGYEPETILSFLEEKGLTLGAILLTHGHFDHVGAVRLLAAETGCRVYLCKEDLALPPMLTDGALYYTDSYQDGDTLSLWGLTIRVLQTPGHTPGSVCLLAENCMFSGDTLFAGSCGRTDFKGGDQQAMMASLKKLGQLPGNLRVLPGHMEESTLDAERQVNPWMREALKA